MSEALSAARQRSRADNRATLARLRATYGPQHWLTVVGGVTANAYRLAGMTGEEFGALLRDETGLINIQTRRKPLMRLCKGFDGCGGVIKDEGDWVSMFVQFGFGSYADFKGAISGSLQPGGQLGPGVPPCRVDAVTPSAPRCLAGETVTSIERLHWGAIIEVRGRWETLAPMPDEVAACLGIEPQRHLGHIPWLNYESLAPTMAAVPAVSAGAAEGSAGSPALKTAPRRARRAVAVAAAAAAPNAAQSKEHDTSERLIRPARTMPHDAIRARIAGLRAAYGVQDWLTLVGSVTANAYHLAGMTGVEFGALLRAEMGIINIQERRRPLMGLRLGFDPVSGGVIVDRDGIVEMFFHFDVGTYSERKSTVSAHLGPDHPVLTAGQPPCRIEAIVPSVPPCLAGVRAWAIEWKNGGAVIDVEQNLETLALMPDDIAEELGVAAQRRTDQIPWLYDLDRGQERESGRPVA